MLYTAGKRFFDVTLNIIITQHAQLKRSKKVVSGGCRVSDGCGIRLLPVARRARGRWALQVQAHYLTGAFYSLQVTSSEWSPPTPTVHVTANWRLLCSRQVSNVEINR